MGIFGLWPLTKGHFILRYRSFVTAILMFSLIVVPRMTAVVILWGEWDFIVQSVAYTVTFFMSVVKMLTIFTRKKGN